jgi:hypothetical protein
VGSKPGTTESSGRARRKCADALSDFVAIFRCGQEQGGNNPLRLVFSPAAFASSEWTAAEVEGVEVDQSIELIESQTTPGGVIIQVYRPAGRPEYGTSG